MPVPRGSSRAGLCSFFFGVCCPPRRGGAPPGLVPGGARGPVRGGAPAQRDERAGAAARVAGHVVLGVALGARRARVRRARRGVRSARRRGRSAAPPAAETTAVVALAPAGGGGVQAGRVVRLFPSASAPAVGPSSTTAVGPAPERVFLGSGAAFVVAIGDVRLGVGAVAALAARAARPTRADAVGPACRADAVRVSPHISAMRSSRNAAAPSTPEARMLRCRRAAASVAGLSETRNTTRQSAAFVGAIAHRVTQPPAAAGPRFVFANPTGPRRARTRQAARRRPSSPPR